MRRLFCALLAALFMSPWLAGDPGANAPAAAAFIGWLDDDHWLAARDGRLLKVEALSGKEAGFSRLEDLPGNSTDDGEPLAERAATLLAAQRAGASFEELSQPDRPLGGAGPFQNINQVAIKSDLPTASGDGKWIATNRKNDMYLIEKATKKERRLTTDGSDLIFNGRADAVYQEEIFFPSRSLRAFWWSPDSAHIAFLRLDDSAVAKFTLINPTQSAQTPETTTYPKPGAANPTVKIGVAHVADQPITWIDLSQYSPKDLIISRLGWHPSSKQVYFYAQNRQQTWLDLCVADGDTGKCQKLFRDQTKAWILDTGYIGPVHFLKDGSFLWFSQRSGFKHLYHYAADGTLKNAVTRGDWNAHALNKVDEAEGWAYFNGDKDEWLGSVPYRVKLDGTGLEPTMKASPGKKAAGTHDVKFSPSGKYGVDAWSDFATPTQLIVFRGDGTPVRAVAPAQQAKGQNKAELVKVKAPDGVDLAATVLFPPKMDPSKKYPVWFSTYGGPHMPTIRNAFAGGKTDQIKAAQGYIVFHADPRSSSSTPHLSWSCYKQLGVQELKDIETCLKWLLDTYPAADARRIGISGHSYGGYLAAYALTHSKMFAAGIAGAPPTDWRLYNSFYVERYMSTPEDNPKGYEASSVLAGAKNLHGKLLLMHGMMDDNVHLTNTIQLADAFQKANLDFDMMLYPHARHGFFGAHVQRVQNDFMRKMLQP